MEDLNAEQIKKLQHKCPHSRMLLNNTQAFEITLKLIIQYIKIQSLISTNQNYDKNQLMKALKFVVEKFMKIDNFDEIEEQSHDIQPINTDMIDILMNSAVYYQKKYTREIGHMQEVFPIEDPSMHQSPLKNVSLQNSEIKPKPELTAKKLPFSESNSNKSETPLKLEEKTPEKKTESSE